MLWFIESWNWNMNTEAPLSSRKYFEMKNQLALSYLTFQTTKQYFLCFLLSLVTFSFKLNKLKTFLSSKLKWVIEISENLEGSLTVDIEHLYGGIKTYHIWLTVFNNKEFDFIIFASIPLNRLSTFNIELYFVEFVKFDIIIARKF